MNIIQDQKRFPQKKDRESQDRYILLFTDWVNQSVKEVIKLCKRNFN